LQKSKDWQEMLASKCVEKNDKEKIVIDDQVVRIPRLIRIEKGQPRDIFGIE
jgi:hypothetical protein